MLHILRDPSSEQINTIKEKFAIDEINHQKVASFNPRIKNDGLVGNDLLIIANSVNQPDRKFSTLAWGLQLGDGKNRLTVDIEDLNNPAYSAIVLKRHCIIFAQGFFVNRIDTNGGRVPYLIHPIIDEIFCFGGIWNTWKSDEGLLKAGCAIVTQKISPDTKLGYANNIDLISPLILSHNQDASWLQSLEPSLIDNFKKENIDDMIQGHTISPAINLTSTSPFDMNIVNHIRFSQVPIL